jgi:hypothetical protein
MASVQFNISKGREVELYERVNTNDPTNSALILMVLESGSASGLSGLPDFDTFAAILAGGYTEVGNANYARKTLTDADLAAWAPDDTNNWIRLVLPLQSWANIGSGDTWDLGVVGYDPDTTGGTDSAIVPITGSELRENGTALVPNSSTMVVDFSSAWITAT